jgi:hypothetical protein
MDIEKARDFIRKNHRGVLTTYRQDNSLQMSPIIVGIDDDGQAMISSRETAYR